MTNVTLVEKWEEIEYAPKAVSTDFQANEFVTYDGIGGIIPATPGDPILGLNGRAVTSADDDYAAATPIPYQVANGFTFEIPVTTGTADATMVGSPFDLDTASSLDVSGAGTQFVMTKFISATLVQVRAILLA